MNHSVVQVVDMSDPKPKMAKEAFYAVVLLTVIGFICLLLYWVNFPQDVYTINNNVNERGEQCVPDRSHDGDTTPFYRGCGIPAYARDKFLVYQADFCAETDARGNLQALFINKQTGEQAAKIESPISFHKEECLNREAVLVVPETVTPGEYYVRFIVDVKVNPIKSIHKETQTLTFKIDE